MEENPSYSLSQHAWKESCDCWFSHFHQEIEILVSFGRSHSSCPWSSLKPPPVVVTWPPMTPYGLCPCGPCGYNCGPPDSVTHSPTAQLRLCWWETFLHPWCFVPGKGGQLAYPDPTQPLRRGRDFSGLPNWRRRPGNAHPQTACVSALPSCQQSLLP